MNQPDIEPNHRVLKAILFADVAGYSRMLQDDEVQTQRSVTELVTLFEAKCREFGGEVQELRGDGIFALFESAVNSVRFAHSTQERVAEFNAQLPEERKIRFRIGIHLGDVLKDNKLHFGDNINIAARLESQTKAHGCDLIVSVDTLEAENLPYDPTSVLEFDVRGRNQGVRACRLQANQLTMTPGA